MKISYKKADSSNSTPYAVMKKAAYKFKIESSILKTHYKELARMAFLFNSEERNSGYILPENVDKFLALIDKAEKANDKVCKKSHQSSIEKSKNRRQSRISEDALEDLQDEIPAYRGASNGELIDAAKKHGYTY